MHHPTVLALTTGQASEQTELTRRLHYDGQLQLTPHHAPPAPWHPQASDHWLIGAPHQPGQSRQRQAPPDQALGSSPALQWLTNHPQARDHTWMRGDTDESHLAQLRGLPVLHEPTLQALQALSLAMNAVRPEAGLHAGEALLGLPSLVITAHIGPDITRLPLPPVNLQLPRSRAPGSPLRLHLCPHRRLRRAALATVQRVMAGHERGQLHLHAASGTWSAALNLIWARLDSGLIASSHLHERLTDHRGSSESTTTRSVLCL